MRGETEPVMDKETCGPQHQRSNSWCSLSPGKHRGSVEKEPLSFDEAVVPRWFLHQMTRELWKLHFSRANTILYERTFNLKVIGYS